MLARMSASVRSTRVEGGATRPLGKILCVGRNYGDHAREMGVALPEEPFFFLKPATSFRDAPSSIALPSFSRAVHYEVEMVVRVGVFLRNATLAEADRSVDAVAVGLDLTARDVQAQAKGAGLPWTLAKGFDGAAPIGPFVAVGAASDCADLGLRLEVNDVIRQHARTSAMVHGVPALLAFLAARMTLEPGDLLFTGTPAGVGPLAPGDHLLASLSGAPSLECRVVADG